MREVNIVSDVMDKYSEEEIISYLSRVLNGVSKNYQVALKTNQPEVLWGNLGDIELAASILKGMDKVYKLKLAQKAL